MRQMSEHEGSWACMIVTYGLAFYGRAGRRGAVPAAGLQAK